MKRYFIIDLENVGKNAITGVAAITPEDVFVICTNRMHVRVPSELVAAIEKSPATLRVVEIANCAKNALDFCVATQLGYLICEDRNAEFWIVSNDRAFEACISFGKSMGVKVGVTPSFDVARARKASQEEEREMLKALLPEFSPKCVALTQRALTEAKDLNGYHNALQKVLYETQMKTVYQRTKHLLATQKA